MDLETSPEHSWPVIEIIDRKCKVPVPSRGDESALLYKLAESHWRIIGVNVNERKIVNDSSILLFNQHAPYFNAQHRLVNVSFIVKILTGIVNGYNQVKASKPGNRLPRLIYWQDNNVYIKSLDVYSTSSNFQFAFIRTNRNFIRIHKSLVKTSEDQRKVSI